MRNDKDQKELMTAENQKDQNDFPEEKWDHITFTLGQSLFERIENHIQKLKMLSHSNETKQRWIIQAILEKVEHWESSERFQVTKHRSIALRIKPSLNKKIEEIIKFSKKLPGIRGNSKKNVILEAIQEKLEKEESEIKEKFRKMQKGNEND